MTTYLGTGAYELRVIAPPTGSNPGEWVETIRNVQIQQVEFQLNDMGALTEWLIPTAEPTAAPYVGSPGQWEAQVWRTSPVDGSVPELLWWGVLSIKPQLQGEQTRVYAANLLWYLHKLFFGRAGRTQYLTNPDFSSGLTGWTAVGGCSPAVSSSDPFYGPDVVELTEGSAGADSYLQQQVAFSSGSAPVVFYLSAWFYLSSFSAPAGPGFQCRGLYVNAVDGSGNTLAGAAPAAWQITRGTPGGSWQEAQAWVEFPAGTSGYLDCRLYAPEGVTRWAACSLVTQDSLSTPAAGEDQGTTMSSIVDYAQGRILAAADGTKVDLNIGVPTPPVTGVTRVQSYQFADHANILEALQEYPALVDGPDFDVTWDVTTEPATRTFTIYNMRRGSFRPDLPLIHGPGGNVDLKNSQIYCDGDEAASSVVELGDDYPVDSSSGAARYEGGARDVSLSGGLELELVERASTGLPIGALAGLASKRLGQLGGTGPVYVIRVKDENVISLNGGLRPGDCVPVDIQYGWVSITGVWQVVQVDIYPAQGDVVDVTINLPRAGADVGPGGVL